MQVVLVVDDRLLCVMGEDCLSVMPGHQVHAFTLAEEAAAWCEQPDNAADVVLISLVEHGAGAGLNLAGRIARAQPKAKIRVTSGVFREVPSHMPGHIQLLTIPYTGMEFFDIDSFKGDPSESSGRL